MTDHAPEDRDVAAIPRLLLTVTEAGKSLGISRSMVYELIAGGHLVSVKVGGARRISYGSLVAFVRRLEEGGSVKYP
ncbi:MAG TPA: helix-turn-helix domain-containing protein [Mycobacterium sp.]|nr:helix-turn-helix domain-containing protein [Mycobacterium sp.]